MKKILLTIAIVLASLNCVAAPESAKKADAKPAVERVEKKQDQSTGRPWKGHEVFRGFFTTHLQQQECSHNRITESNIKLLKEWRNGDGCIIKGLRRLF